MIITNIETVPGKEIVLNTTESCPAIRFEQNTWAVILWLVLKILVGGELKGYTELLSESRKEAIQRMVAQAQRHGCKRCD